MTLAPALPPDDDDRRALALRASFERFVAENYSRLLSFLQRQCFDRHLAEDALHEALIVTMNKWHVVGGHERPLFWVRKTAWHKLLTLQGRQKPAAALPLDAMAQDIAEPTGSHEVEMVLRYVLGRLPVQQRAVLALMVEGETDEEIALQLGLAVTTVRTYKSDVRKRYRDLAATDGEARPA